MTLVEIVAQPPDDNNHTTWLARVDGGKHFPIASYVLEPGGEGGAATVNLIVAADQVSIGDLHHRPAEPERRNSPPMSTWGSPAPDPRANIPGWQLPPAAADAHRGGHRVTYTWPARLLALLGVRRFA